MFGDFWRSKKGGACFRPKNPQFAKDLLVRVSWGGCFNSHRGTYSDEANAIEGVKYFRRASSNGGGAGNDYWVVPVGFSRILHIDEVDGETKTDHTAEFGRRAKAYREKHAKLQRETSESNDKAYKAKLAAEEESRQAKAGLVTRLEAVKECLVPLNEFFGEHCWDRKTFEILDSYFKMEYTQYLYTVPSASGRLRKKRKLWVYRAMFVSGTALALQMPAKLGQLPLKVWIASVIRLTPQFAEAILRGVTSHTREIMSGIRLCLASWSFTGAMPIRRHLMNLR